MESEKHTHTACQNRCRPKVERVYEDEQGRQAVTRPDPKGSGQRIVFASSGRVIAGFLVAFGLGYGVGRWASSR
jgi:hypothetical protein